MMIWQVCRLSQHIRQALADYVLCFRNDPLNQLGTARNVFDKTHGDTCGESAIVRVASQIGLDPAVAAGQCKQLLMS
ncbi:hypothetical protein D3C81_1887620 [compost metagenome]